MSQTTSEAGSHQSHEPTQPDEHHESQTTLNAKINEHFAGTVVRKDLVATVRDNAQVPSYVLEYLLGQYAASDDETTIQGGIDTVQRILAKHYVQRHEHELIKSEIRRKGRHRVIDKVSVTLNERRNLHEASFENLQLRDVVIDDLTVKRNPKLLVSGVWCICDLEWEHSDERGTSPWILDSLKPIQVAGVDLDDYRAAREHFTTEEWIDLLMQSIGLEPSQFDARGKLIALTRLIPFAERNYNLVELGPKGTGKSHIFSEFSPNGILLSGGEVTLAKLFVNNSTGHVGLVGYWDSVAFDEFAANRRADSQLVNVMKNYMANRSFSRGASNYTAEASLAFIGNTTHTVPYMLKNSDLFDELPQVYRDPAWLDRIHCYLPGWEVAPIRSEMFSSGYGFVVDYLAEILRALRAEDYSSAYSEHFTLDASISTRDQAGIRKTFSGLMKLIHPSGQAERSELQTLLDFAIEGRKRVKDSIMRIDATMRDPELTFDYTDATGSVYHVTTAEERRYPQLYTRDWSASEQQAEEPVSGEQSRHDSEPSAMPVRAEGEAPTKTEPATSALTEPQPGHVDIHAGQRGVSYETLLMPYLRGATKLRIIDPYVRKPYQIRNLTELLAMLAAHTDEGTEIDVALETVPEDDSDALIVQTQHLNRLAYHAHALGIRLELIDREPGTIHDRRIETNTGWRIDLGRGLDIWSRPEANDPFALVNQSLRRVRSDFTVHYLRTESELS